MSDCTRFAPSRSPLWISIPWLALVLTACSDPWTGIPASTDATSAGGDDSGGTSTTSTSTGPTTNEPPTVTSTTGDTTVGVTAGETTTDGTTGTSTTGGETTTGETTTDGTTGTGTTGGESTTGGTTMDGEEPCPAFVSTPDIRFEALLQSMQLQAVSPSAADLPSGLAVAIVVDGELLHAGGVGTRAKEGHPLAAEPVDAETRFSIASTSKWMHGTMISSMVEDGLLAFEASITDVLPEYTETNGMQADITLHRLLTMTSGLDMEVTHCSLMSVSASVHPLGCASFSTGPGTILERLFDPARLITEPYKTLNMSTGTPGKFIYSNWGIMLSGRIAEVAGGAPYPDLVATRVFAPAGMCTATYDPAAIIVSGNYAVGTGSPDWDGDCPEPELGHDSKAPWEPEELACRARDPNGGIRASVVDVGRFAAAFLADLQGTGTMLGPTMAHRMLCPGGGTHDQDCMGRVDSGGYAGSETYGYNNFKQTTLGFDVYTHGGGRPGYGALFWLVPARDFAVVILGNEIDTYVVQSEWAEEAIDCWLNDNC